MNRDKIKWIFFDMGSTLIDESIAIEHRIREVIEGTNITYEQFIEKKVFFATHNKPADLIGIIANQSLGSEERLKQFGIWKYIDELVASAEEGVAKPDKRIFEIALTRTGCKPEEAAMVGDRLDNDIVPANDLGMYTIWMKQGNRIYATPKEQLEYPDWTIGNLSELKALVEK